ncbi:MAG: TPR end-of-group domain-containing protein [Solirubrobacterales bacterium]
MPGNEGPVRVASIVDAESVPIDGGKVQWVPLRRSLGIGAFGTNAYRAERAGDVVIEDHVESPGQEEMYVVISGAMLFTADGLDTEIAAGDVVFVADPQVRRGAVAQEDETIVLAVGGWTDQPYHSLPWEPIYLAQDAMLKGDWAAAAETLEREAGEHRETAIVQMRLACCHAQLGEDEIALTELRRALKTNPRMQAMAEDDELLAPLRDLPGWPGADMQ